jgi:hypothetical protein
MTVTSTGGAGSYTVSTSQTTSRVVPCSLNDVPRPVNRNGHLMISRQETAGSLLTPGELDRRSATTPMPIAHRRSSTRATRCRAPSAREGPYHDSRGRKGRRLPRGPTCREAQVAANGATWLDRQLVAREPVSTGGGFGAEVRDTMERRLDYLAGEELARRQGQRVVFARDLINQPRQRELDAAAAKLADETGLAHRPSGDGEYVAGTFRQWVPLASGRFARHARADHTTTEPALKWATQPAHAQPSQWANRLGMVARYCLPNDPRVVVPPPNLLPHRYRRVAPYIDQEIIVSACSRRQGSCRLRAVCDPPPLPHFSVCMPPAACEPTKHCVSIAATSI